MMTHINPTFTKRTRVQTDKNGYYHLSRYEMLEDGTWGLIAKGREIYKHAHSLHKAMREWLTN